MGVATLHFLFYCACHAKLDLHGGDSWQWVVAAVVLVRFVAKECGIVRVDGGVTVVVRDNRRVSGECVIRIDGRFKAK